MRTPGCLATTAGMICRPSSSHGTQEVHGCDPAACRARTQVILKEGLQTLCARARERPPTLTHMYYKTCTAEKRDVGKKYAGRTKRTAERNGLKPPKKKSTPKGGTLRNRYTYPLVPAQPALALPSPSSADTFLSPTYPPVLANTAGLWLHRAV